MTNDFVLQGRAWIFGNKLDADWQICSLDRLDQLKKQGIPLIAEELGKYCLESVDPDFVHRVSPGDFIVAGENVGYSAACLDGDPDDPHFIGAASLAIKGAGVSAVLCESSGMGFLMTSINLGLPVVECQELHGKVHTGDQLQLNLTQGVIANLDSGEEYRFMPYPPRLLEMVREGGLYAHLEGKGKQ
jgi:3-isopropylmalate/(R)-2-methylmalate dehydratase small subunit